MRGLMEANPRVLITSRELPELCSFKNCNVYKICESSKKLILNMCHKLINLLNVKQLCLNARHCGVAMRKNLVKCMMCMFFIS